MKALIISDDKNLTGYCSEALKKNNYDLIIYKWLLKALDNIEEIQPDLIVLSSSEYPRHWKTLVQFVKSGIGGENVQIYLFEPTPLSKEDLDKAKILGINGYFSDPHDFDGILSGEAEEIPEVSDILDNTEIIDAEIIKKEIPAQIEIPFKKSESVTEKSEPLAGHILLTNPETNSFMTGKVISKNETTLSCLLDFNTNLKPETIIPKCSFIWNNKIECFEGKISSINNKNLEILILQYYEE